MTDAPPEAFAPTWLVVGTLGSALLAAGSLFIDGAVVELLTGVFVLCTFAGTTALLYLWGKHRERPSEPDDDGERMKEREAEVQAEISGAGMN